MDHCIIVSGGAGYIGSHACKALKLAGYIPITFDNLKTGWKDAVKFGPFEQGDLLNKSDIGHVFKKYNPVAVMHFAALSQVSESMQLPGLYWETNVQGSLNLIQAAVDHRCKNFVFSSTCATYGNQDNVILDENSQQYPTNAYGSSKLAVESILRDFEKACGLNSVIFRYFNVAGVDPDAEVGEFHRPETHLIPLILDAIDGNRDSLTINGTDYDTQDGTCIRDYVHVCDLVDAHVLGLKWLLDGKGSRVFNLGTGDGFSVREVIDHVKHVTNKEVPVILGQRRPGDCTKLVSGSNRATNELGWSADRSNLKQMITDAWRWHQNGSYKE
ncbi:UDP-glucose 4-epimerase GalE [Rhodobacteraceae bacterium]|nr:UDP-glucose 4-epimerase GalE [Paracoccaceae bacterium]